MALLPDPERVLRPANDNDTTLEVWLVPGIFIAAIVIGILLNIGTAMLLESAPLPSPLPK